MCVKRDGDGRVREWGNVMGGGGNRVRLGLLNNATVINVVLCMIFVIVLSKCVR